MLRTLLIAALAGATFACAAVDRRSGGAPSAREAERGIDFIHDDYEAARARAAAEGKPLFVDAWAPW